MASRTRPNSGIDSVEALLCGDHPAGGANIISRENVRDFASYT